MAFRWLKFTILSYLLTAIFGHESDSAESNKIEISPYYDTIIISDVADVINELENNANPLEAIFSSGSESDENIEDLLTEYQHYLERAHKQRMNANTENSNTKNKVPLVRHDRYARTKPAGGLIKYQDYYPNTNTFSVGYMGSKVLQPQFYTSPLDSLGTFFSKLSNLGKSDFINPAPKDPYAPYDKYDDKKLIQLPPVFPKTRYDPLKSSCFCKNNQLPCECNCKQCLFPLDWGLSKQLNSADLQNRLMPLREYAADEKVQNNDQYINLRIKVEIQVPKTQESVKNHSRDVVSSKETLTYPFPFFNFPIPLNLLGYKKSSKVNNHESSHKLAIHKKKKSRNTSGNKKHKKKLITFHNVNIQDGTNPIKVSSVFENNVNNTVGIEKIAGIIVHTSNAIEANTATEVPEAISNVTDHIATTNYTELSTDSNILNTTEENIIYNETQTESDIVYVTVNITDGASIAMNRINSIEREFSKVEPNEKRSERIKKIALRDNLAESFRRKREMTDQNELNKTTSFPNTTVGPILRRTTTVTPISTNITDTKKIDKSIIADAELKKSDKSIIADAELTYWPNNSINQTDLLKPVKNITMLILERETKKSKFNMTKESIINNHTTALERAIFGEVKWEDVDAVAPMFMSFVGKYLKGVLSFCSENICHSMKCDEKTCIHRECLPKDRWNQRGHCIGSNATDTVASLESLMDLPSNVAFEIVDILQDNMLGELFGKVTLCIHSKCISFVANKKNFLKSKCTLKELVQGYCPNLKNSKMP